MPPPPETLSYAPPLKRLPVVLRISFTILIISAIVFALFNFWMPAPRMYPIDGPAIQHFGTFNYLRIERSNATYIYDPASNTWSESYRTNIWHWHYPALAATFLLTLLSLALTLLVLRHLHRARPLPTVSGAT